MGVGSWNLLLGPDIESRRWIWAPGDLPRRSRKGKNSDKLCLQGPPWQNKSTGSCSEGTNQQKNCKANNLKKSKADFPDREISLALSLDYLPEKETFLFVILFLFKNEILNDIFFNCIAF